MLVCLWNNLCLLLGPCCEEDHSKRSCATDVDATSDLCLKAAGLDWERR